MVSLISTYTRRLREGYRVLVSENGVFVLVQEVAMRLDNVEEPPYVLLSF